MARRIASKLAPTKERMAGQAQRPHHLLVGGGIFAMLEPTSFLELNPNGLVWMMFLDCLDRVRQQLVICWRNGVIKDRYVVSAFSQLFQLRLWQGVSGKPNWRSIVSKGAEAVVAIQRCNQKDH